jgi:hypothetical protein
MVCIGLDRCSMLLLCVTQCYAEHYYTPTISDNSDICTCDVVRQPCPSLLSSGCDCYTTAAQSVHELIVTHSFAHVCNRLSLLHSIAVMLDGNSSSVLSSSSETALRKAICNCVVLYDSPKAGHYYSVRRL